MQCLRILSASLVVVSLAGCAGYQVLTPEQASECEERIVEYVVLSDLDIVRFDGWEPAGNGRDIRARIAET